MNVVILKMISGEEIIARKDGNMYERVNVFRMMQDGQGGVQAGLVPYIMVAPDAKFPINPSLVVAEIPCPAEVEKNYLQATSPIALS